jgi:glycine/D-amino acid oxidase-like deaminating enzyme
MDKSDSTVIIGAGINGLATAFYLASTRKRGDNIWIIETSSDVVSSASGKANGILSDYGRTAPVADLAHLSWKLHQQLATVYEGAVNWGYTKTVRHELLNASDLMPGFQAQYPLPEWIRKREQYFQLIKGNPYNCARLYVCLLFFLYRMLPG